MAVRSRTPGIVLRFAVYAGVALVLAAGAGVLLARADATSRARSDVKADAGFLADRLARDDLSRTAFLWPRRGDAADTTSLLDAALDPKDAAPDALRLTLVSPDGVVTYSSDHSLLGRRLGRVPTGTRTARVGDRKVLESYVPVYWVMDPVRPRGYLGLARDYGPVAAQIRRTFALQAGSIALALLILYLALLPIMHRLTARLQRTLAERQRLASIVEFSNEAIVGRDRDGVITSWNAAAEHVYGWSAEATLGQPLDFVLPDASDERPERASELAVMLAISDTGRDWHAERMGLGLAAVFGLVEQSGGTIGVESNPTEGTTVRVYLPRTEQAAVERVA